MWYDFLLLGAVAGTKSTAVMVHLTGPPNGRTVITKKLCNYLVCASGFQYFL